MKTLGIALATTALTAMSFTTPDNTLTTGERKYATDLLVSTRDNLLKKVKGLTPEQLNFKPDANTWSVAECVEHITLSETQLFALAQSSLKEPADPSKRSDVKTTDDDIVKMVADRSQKRQARETLVPTGKYGSFEATLADFKKHRDQNIQYIKTTSDDLRNHYNDLPFGKADAFQTILLMAAHSKRHTSQIEELLSNPAFPKK